MNGQIPIDFVAYLFILTSLLFNQRYLRHTLAFFGGLTLVILAKFSPDYGIREFEVWFGLCMAGINLVFVAHQIWGLVLPLDKELSHLYYSYFRNFSRSNFKKLMNIAVFENKANGSTIVRQGDSMDFILVVLDGHASVIVDGNKVADLHNGDYIGDMSFLSGQRASATVRSNILTTYLIWRQAELHALLKRDPVLLVEFHKALEKQLTKKIAERGHPKVA